MLIASGASVKAVQARLGHRSVKTLLDTDGHLYPEEKSYRNPQAIDAAFAPSAEDKPRSEGIWGGRDMPSNLHV